MEKTKEYDRTLFPAEVIQEAVEIFDKVFYDDIMQNDLESQLQYVQDKKQRAKIKKEIRCPTPDLSLSVKHPDESWEYENEGEFFASYRKTGERASYRRYYVSAGVRLYVSTSFDYYEECTDTRVTVEGKDRDKIEQVFEVFEKYYPEYYKPKPPPPEPPPPEPPPKPTIFIGHGRNDIWRDLKDHLHEQHGYDIEAYEIGARAGHEIRDVLEQMLKKSTIAVLVMTGEDKTAEGDLLPRLNVIHEAGLFQGRLGFHRAIILLEEGTEEFSNIEGIHQIRFSRGNIKETYGDVLATIKREFPDHS